MAVPTKGEILGFSPINSGGREELPAYRRKAFPEMEKALKTRLIVSITGLRRVGKTTLMKQLLGKNSFYFSFDEKKHANPETLKRVIEVFLEDADKPLIALDEIFRVEDWAGVIKRYHDQKRASFLISGSSSLMVKKGVESLSGRLSEHHLPPLQFGEYLGLTGKSPPAYGMEGIFRPKKRHDEELHGFLQRGSFPEAALMEAQDAAQYIQASIVEKIIFDDIPAIFRIEHPSKLHDLFRLCATNSGRLYTEVNFAEALQISRHAVSDYMLYLQKSFLAGVIYPQGSFQKGLKKQKKVFASSASIYNAVAENPSAGQAAETAVYDRLSQNKLAFYRDSQQREVDFLQDMPIEVKFQSAITRQDTSSLIYYMKKYGRKEGIVVTKSLLDEKTIGEKRLIFIPLDLFLLADISKPAKEQREG